MKLSTGFCDEIQRPEYWQLDTIVDFPAVPRKSVLLDHYDETTTPDGIRHTFKALQKIQREKNLRARSLCRGDCLPTICYTQGLVRITLDVVSDESLTKFPATWPMNKLRQNSVAEEMTNDLLYSGPSAVYSQVGKGHNKARTMRSTVLYGLQSFSGDQMLFLEAEQLGSETARNKKYPELLPQTMKVGQLYKDRARYVRVTNAKLLGSAVNVELPDTGFEWVASNAKRMIEGFDAE